jgi:copper chaperone
VTSISRVKTVLIDVEGMTCEHCVMRVTKALQGVKGVRTVKVDLAGKKAEVVIDIDEAKEPSLVKAIEKVGFKAKIA